MASTPIFANGDLNTHIQDRNPTTVQQNVQSGVTDNLISNYQFQTGEFITSSLDFFDEYQPVDAGQITSFKVNIEQLANRERTIIVYHPSDDLDSVLYYPVIYLLNAQEVFISSPSNNNKWLVNSAMFSIFTSAFDGEAIIVGITDDFAHYWDEHSPWINNHMYAWVDPGYAEQTEGGEGDAFLTFITDGLKPYIDQHFRTLSGRETTAIGGYDMGGLLSIYAGVNRSDVFSKVMALSPAVWFAEKSTTWLSNNHLRDLIIQTNFSDEISFYLSLGPEGEHSDIDVHPEILDQSGKHITYAQAYFYGSQMVINALRDLGLPQVNIVSNIVDDEQRFDSQYANLTEIIQPQHTYHFPIVLLQEMINFNISMSPYLNRSRRIWVYLPPNYHAGDQSYPVLYVLDALRHFNPYNSPTIPTIDDWKTDEVLDELYDPTGFQGIIVVGIEHHPTTYRWSEYNRFNQYNMDNWVNDGSEVVYGEGDALVNFIVHKLKPTIDARYRTLPDREYTAIGSASRAGYLAINAGLTHPETFSKVMAMSPAVWLAEGGAQTDHPIWLSSNRLINWINKNSIPKNVKFFIYFGGNEVSTGGGYPFVYRTSSINSKITYPQAYVEGAQAVILALNNKGGNTTFRYRADGQHHAIYWRAPFIEALTLFGFYPGNN